MRDRPGAVGSVTGAVDLAPAAWAAKRSLEQQLLSAFAGYGYQGIGVPLLEYSELYERKAGARVVAQLLPIPDQAGRQICLRPEFTASVVRAWAGGGGGDLPARLMYSGPAFRRREQRSAPPDQFTETGAELIGVPGPIGDAEIISMACSTLDQVEVWERRIVLGHLGVLGHLFSDLGLSLRARTLLLEGLADIRRPGGGIASARRRALDRYRGLAPSSPRGPVSGLDRQQLGDLADSISGGIAGFGGVRSREQIVARLANKLERGDESAQLESAFDLLGSLSKCRGPVRKALTDTTNLLAQRGLASGPLAELAQLLNLLEGEGLDLGPFEFDPVLGRGLQYYTGLVFEIFAPQDGEWVQICGGGRYDDLLAAIAPVGPAPAVGLSFRVERLLEAGGQHLASAGERSPADVMVIPRVGCEGAALALAKTLRKSWLRTVIGTDDTDLASLLKKAKNQSIPVAVRQSVPPSQSVTVWDLGGVRESVVDQQELPPAIFEIVGQQP